MNRRSTKALAGLVVSLAALSVLATAGWERQPIQTRIDNSAVCLECHDGYEKSLAGSVHALTMTSGSDNSMAVTCIDCHDGWEEHLDDASAETIEQGAEVKASALAVICARCHVTSHQTSIMSTDPHAAAGLSCADCHRVHNNPAPALTLDDRENYCTACHSNVVAEFKRRSSHPLESGNVRCVDCHTLGTLGDPLTTIGIDWRCQQCHSEVSGPFRYEHPVANAHLVEGSGCVACHQPHGSANDRLLNQPGNGTCGQCHSIPAGHRTMHAGLGSQMPCVDCHTGIHGSNDNGKLLDPLLGARLFPDCYQSGCHSVSEQGGLR
jgi:DmsE family decaheme c-type cytochrome